MNKIIATVAAAAMLIGAQTSAEASSKGAKFALGVAIGVGVVGLLAAKSAQASHDGYQVRHYSYSTGGHGRPDGACRTWRIDCRDGFDRACRKYERHC